MIQLFGVAPDQYANLTCLEIYYCLPEEEHLCMLQSSKPPHNITHDISSIDVMNNEGIRKYVLKNSLVYLDKIFAFFKNDENLSIIPSLLSATVYLCSKY